MVSGMQNCKQMCPLIWWKEKCWCCVTIILQKLHFHFLLFFFPFHHRSCTTWKWKISFQFHYLCFTILPLISEQVMSCTPNHRTTLFPELPGKIQNKHIQIQQILWYGSMEVSTCFHPEAPQHSSRTRSPSLQLLIEQPHYNVIQSFVLLFGSSYKCTVKYNLYLSIYKFLRSGFRFSSNLGPVQIFYSAVTI